MSQMAQIEKRIGGIICGHRCHLWLQMTQMTIGICGHTASSAEPHVRVARDRDT
jgi:hypothetical protein